MVGGRLSLGNKLWQLWSTAVAVTYTADSGSRRLSVIRSTRERRRNGWNV